MLTLQKRGMGTAKFTAPIPQNPVADNKTVIEFYIKQNHLKIIGGSITAKTPTAMLATTYITAVTAEPPFINSAVSRENVEKVVKPPHIPTFKKAVISIYQYLRKVLPCVRQDLIN